MIGAGGASLKKIGTLARLEIEKMLARKVFLELFVKVQKDWRENPEFLNAIDWRSMRGGELRLGRRPSSIMRLLSLTILFALSCAAVGQTRTRRRLPTT